MLDTSSTAFRTLVSWVDWHPMTWQALSISPYRLLRRFSRFRRRWCSPPAAPALGARRRSRSSPSAFASPPSPASPRALSAGPLITSTRPRSEQEHDLSAELMVIQTRKGKRRRIFSVDVVIDLNSPLPVLVPGQSRVQPPRCPSPPPHRQKIAVRWVLLCQWRRRRHLPAGTRVGMLAGTLAWTALPRPLPG